jgi:hypothetical protein
MGADPPPPLSGRSGQFWGQKSLDPLEIDDYVFCPHKKITSRTIKISGSLIVIARGEPLLVWEK